ncbi:MAG: right-handed parallel beta-helix repeat-containing protein, partial [Actinomycetota bacterium]
FPSIQEAVDAARPNDLVLMSPKVYEEETVVVSTPNLVLRGLDRNGVILDGALKQATGVLIAANGVTVENMTARGYLANGFYWSRVDGFRGSYLTAVGNGDFGLYASGSRNGQLDHVFASGQPDAGVHVAGCDPCNILVTDSRAIGNGAGFSTTNTGGNLAVTNSEWARNFAGITLASLGSEPRGPQQATVIAGNWVHDNGNREAPAKPAHFPAFGVGILVAGGEANRIERNLAENNSAYGILVTGNIDGSFWAPFGNRISDNLIRGSGRADLALGGPVGGGNCFRTNQHVASLPPLLEIFYRCGTPLARMGGGDFGVGAERLALFSKSLSGKFPHGDWKSARASDDERPPGMPDPNPAKTRARPADQAPAVSPDTEGIALPKIPPSHSPTKEVVVLGVSPLPTPVSMLLGIYAYALPLALYVTWVSLAFWDLARRDELGGVSRLGWGFFVLALPVIGPAGYLLFSRSTIPLDLRLFVVIGGLLIYGVLTGFAFLITAA